MKAAAAGRNYFLFLLLLRTLRNEHEAVTRQTRGKIFTIHWRFVFFLSKEASWIKATATTDRKIIFIFIAAQNPTKGR